MEEKIIIEESIEKLLIKVIALKEKGRKKGIWFKSDAIDYRNIEISKNKFSFEQGPSMLNPFRSIGKITFKLVELEDDLKIVVDINTYVKYGIAFLAIFHILLSLPILIVEYFYSFRHILKIGLFWFIGWSVISGIIYLSYKLHKNRLEDLAKQIMKDLGLEINDASKAN